MTKKQILKILEVAAIVLILLGIIAVLIYRQTTKADETNSGKIPLEQFTEQIAYDTIPDKPEMDSLSDSIGSALYEAYIEQGLSVDDSSMALSKESFLELVNKLDAQGLLIYDDAGNLTPESKAYISEIAAFSYSDLLPQDSDEAFLESGETLDDIVDMSPSTQAVTDIASDYAELFSKYNLASIEDRLLSLETARNNGDTYSEAIASMSLKIKALETSVNAIKNTPISGDKSNTTTINGCVTDIKTLKDEITTIKNNMNTDAVTPETLNTSVSSVVTKLDNVTTKLNNSNANFTAQIKDLSTKIAEKQTAINNLKSQITSLESSNKTLLESKDSNSKDIKLIQNSQSATDKKLDNFINTQSTTEKSLANLSNSLISLQKDVTTSLNSQNKEFNSLKSNISSDIDSLKKDLEKEVNDKLASTKWIKSIDIDSSEWVYDNTEEKYIHNIYDDLISEQYSNIYITYDDTSIHNRFSYKQTNKCLTILSDDVPEHTIINSIKIENPR